MASKGATGPTVTDSTGSTGSPDWLTDLLIFAFAFCKTFLTKRLTFSKDVLKMAEIDPKPPGLLGVVVGWTSLRSIDVLVDVHEASDPLGPGFLQRSNRTRLIASN